MSASLQESFHTRVYKDEYGHIMRKGASCNNHVIYCEKCNKLYPKQSIELLRMSKEKGLVPLKRYRGKDKTERQKQKEKEIKSADQKVQEQLLKSVIKSIYPTVSHNNNRRSATL